MPNAIPKKITGVLHTGEGKTAKAFIFARSLQIWKAARRPHLPPVPRLYHYTSADGLFGIVDSGVIYASDIRYLNDTSEVEHAIEIGKTYLSELEKGRTPKDGDAGRVLELCRYYFSFPEVMKDEAYVTSFCEDDDILSQWRGYAMGGYAIGFEPLWDGKKVVRNKEVFKTSISKVLYDDNEKKDALETLLSTAATCMAAHEGKEPQEVIEGIRSWCLQEVQEWVHSVKSKHFEEEREWRIISFMSPISKPLTVSTGFITRLRDGQLIPTIKLSSEAGKLPIVSVTCGPNSSNQLTEYAVQRLLDSHDFEAKVTTSNIPFRTHY